jgi:hypothetical protein
MPKIKFKHIDNVNAVGNTMLADMAQNRIKGRVTTGEGDPEDLTGEQARGIIVADIAPKAAYAFENGILVNTHLAEATDKMIVFEIRGNEHNSAGKTTFLQGQLYQAGSGNVVNYHAFTTGYAPNISAFIYSGTLHFWFTRQYNYAKYYIKVWNGGNPLDVTVSNVAKPSSGITKEVTISPTGVPVQTVSSLPTASSNGGRQVYYNNKMWYSNGTSWVEM